MNAKAEYLLAIDPELDSKRRRFREMSKVEMQCDLTQ